jgi:hypothetical protein
MLAASAEEYRAAVTAAVTHGWLVLLRPAFT